MATLYFNAAVDNEWTTLGNWWQDDQFSVAATALPATTDDVVITALILDTQGGGTQTVNSYTVNGTGSIGGMGGYLALIANTATFNDYSVLATSSFASNSTFNDYSQWGSGGTLPASLASAPTVTFNDYSAVRVGSLQSDGIFTFNDYSEFGSTGNEYGTDDCSVLSGTLTFNDNAIMRGFFTFVYTAATTTTFNGNSRNLSGFNTTANTTFNIPRGINGSSILGIV